MDVPREHSWRSGAAHPPPVGGFKSVRPLCALPALAAGIRFTAVDLARCGCVAQGAQASRGFGAAARDRRSAAARMVLVLALLAASSLVLETR